MEGKACCPHCGSELEKSTVEEYTFQCKICDEDFCQCEVLTTKNHERIIKTS